MQNKGIIKGTDTAGREETAGHSMERVPHRRLVCRVRLHARAVLAQLATRSWLPRCSPPPRWLLPLPANPGAAQHATRPSHTATTHNNVNAHAMSSPLVARMLPRRRLVSCAAVLLVVLGVLAALLPTVAAAANCASYTSCDRSLTSHACKTDTDEHVMHRTHPGAVRTLF